MYAGRNREHSNTKVVEIEGRIQLLCAFALAIAQMQQTDNSFVDKTMEAAAYTQVETTFKQELDEMAKINRYVLASFQE